MNTQAQILLTSEGEGTNSTFDLIKPISNLTSIGGVSTSVTLLNGGTSDYLHVSFSLVQPTHIYYEYINGDEAHEWRSTDTASTFLEYNFSELQSTILSPIQLVNYCNGITANQSLGRFCVLEKQKGTGSISSTLDIVYPLFLFDNAIDKISVKFLRVSLALNKRHPLITGDDVVTHTFLKDHTIKKFPEIYTIINSITANMDEEGIRTIDKNKDEEASQEDEPLHYVSSFIPAEYLYNGRTFFMFPDDMYRIFGISDDQLTSYDAIPAISFKRTDASTKRHDSNGHQYYQGLNHITIDPPTYKENEEGLYFKLVLDDSGSRNTTNYPVFGWKDTEYYYRTQEGDTYTETGDISFLDAPRVKNGIDFLYIALDYPKCKDDTYFFSNVKFLNTEKILFVLDLRNNDSNSKTVLSSLQMLNVAVLESGRIDHFKFKYIAYSGVFGGYRTINIGGISMILKPSFLN